MTFFVHVFFLSDVVSDVDTFVNSRATVKNYYFFYTFTKQTIFQNPGTTHTRKFMFCLIFLLFTTTHTRNVSIAVSYIKYGLKM